MTEEIHVFKEWKVVKVRVPADVQERRDRLIAAGKCVGCEEPIHEGERVTRGLCLTCYQGARHQIRKGNVTEEELTRRGQLLPAKPGGGRPANEFTKSLAGR